MESKGDNMISDELLRQHIEYYKKSESEIWIGRDFIGEVCEQLLSTRHDLAEAQKKLKEAEERIKYLERGHVIDSGDLD